MLFFGLCFLTYFYKVVSFLVFCIFFLFAFVEEQRWSIRVVVFLDPSILLGKKSEERRSKYLQGKIQSNGVLRNGETFRIFSFLEFGVGGQSDRKWRGKWECKVLYEEKGTL